MNKVELFFFSDYSIVYVGSISSITYWKMQTSQGVHKLDFEIKKKIPSFQKCNLNVVSGFQSQIILRRRLKLKL